MNRSLKLSMLAALALGSSHAMALELGQIKVKSALGQPLLAEIPVTPEGPADLRDLHARLASDEDFVRAGITEGRTKIPLTFTVVSAPGGGKMIRITSAAAINDPYLDLLVQVDNAAGKSVREYTILLDPPGETAAPPAPTTPAPARTSRRSHPMTPAPAPAPVRRAAPAPAPAEAVVHDGKYGPVQSGQNLSSIAQKVLPAGTDLNQMLLALKQANPDAFYRDNINALKSGAVLRVPSADEARAMTVAAALAEVRRQNSDWRAGTVGAPTNVADSATRANASSSPTPSAADRDDHLALLPSSGKGKSASAGSGKDNGAAVRADLQRSQESLAALQQQGAELKSRLKDLEDINSKNERLLSLKDSEIAELQRKLAEARKGKPVSAETPAAMPPAVASTAGKPAAAAAPTPATTAPLAAAGSVPAKAATAPVASGSAAMPAAPVSAPKPVAASPAPVKPKPVKSKSAPRPVVEEQPWYMQPWAWGAGVVVLLLVFLGVRGRGGKKAAKPSGSSLADRFGSTPVPAGDDEVDIDQEELLDQLAEHPDDIGLHLELVSLYYHRRDVEHFEAAAEAMYAHISDPQQSEWQDVAAMGEDLVPGHPLFVGVDTSVPENEREPLQGFSLDDEYAAADVTEVAPVAPPPMPGPSKISEYHFDFNLTPRHESGRAPLAQPADEAPHAEDDIGFAEHVDDVSLPDIGDAEDAVPSWQDTQATDDGYEPTEFSDDPIDTKLDLARAYLDMGDADGARAMLEEVLNEGSQPQRDTARKLLDNLA